MGLSGVNFAGLSSGIDTESLITNLLSIERRPAASLSTQQTKLLQRDTALKTVTAKLIGVQAAAINLNRLRAFDAVTAESTNKEAVTVSATTGAQLGEHTLKVNSLATSQKLGSKALTSQTNALGIDGQIVINGKAIQIKATDSLQSVASTINSSQSGVNASIISPNPNEFILTLGSTNSGVQGKISLSDAAGGTFLSNTLGIFDAGGATSLKNAIGTTGAASNIFKDSATSVGTLLGLQTPASGSVSIGGQAVSIDLAVDSLSGVASKINAAGISGVSANVVNTTDPITKLAGQRLEITGTQSFTDNNNVLANLGVVQRNLAGGRELTQGADSSFELDGLAASRATNAVTDAISGVTLNLLKDGGATSTIKINADIDGLKTSINNFVKAYNDTATTIRDLSTYDPQTNKTGPLFADPITQSILDSLTDGFIRQVDGLPSAQSLIAQIGINLGQDGQLTVDDAKLTEQLSKGIKEVGRIFRADGVATSPLVKFVSAGFKTQASGVAGFAINITQAAEQGKVTATTAQTQALAQDETLTFGGALFGASTTVPITGGKQISLKAGTALADVVSAINGDDAISKIVVASIESGKLKLTGKAYGSASEFAVASSIADSGNGDTTGIGTAIQVVKGKDVAGTINGESATGTGQFLIGSLAGTNGNPNGKALGLQIQVTATTAGDLGNIVFTSGVANFAAGFSDSQVNIFDGALTVAGKGIQDSINDLQAQGKDLDERIAAKEQRLRAQFAAMEGAITRIKASSAGVAQLAALQTQSSR